MSEKGEMGVVSHSTLDAPLADLNLMETTPVAAEEPAMMSVVGLTAVYMLADER